SLHGIGAAAGYFANWARTAGVNLGVLAHSWSLSVEEQFYVLWPLALVALLIVFRNRSRKWMVAAVLAGAAAAGVERALLAGHAPLLRVLDGLDTNADLLLLGCAAGILVSSGMRVLRRSSR